MMSFGGKGYGVKVPFPSHHIKSTYRSCELSLMTLTQITWRRKCLCFPRCQVALFFILSLEARHHMHTTFKEWGIMFHLLEGRVSISIYLSSKSIYSYTNSILTNSNYIYCIYLEFFHMTDLSILPIYLCNQSYGLMDTFDICWLIIQYYFTLLLKLFHLQMKRLPSVSFLIGPCVLLTYFHHCAHKHTLALP